MPASRLGDRIVGWLYPVAHCEGETVNSSFRKARTRGLSAVLIRYSPLVPLSGVSLIRETKASGGTGTQDAMTTMLWYRTFRELCRSKRSVMTRRARTVCQFYPQSNDAAQFKPERRQQARLAWIMRSLSMACSPWWARSSCTPEVDPPRNRRSHAFRGACFCDLW
jgi:hypothetical protein